MNRNQHLLPEPIQPGPDYECPRCLQRFALKLIRTEADDEFGSVSVYLCMKCDQETEFVETFPKGAI